MTKCDRFDYNPINLDFLTLTYGAALYCFIITIDLQIPLSDWSRQISFVEMLHDDWLIFASFDPFS